MYSLRIFLLCLPLAFAYTDLQDILPDEGTDRFGANLTENFALGRSATQTSTANSGQASLLVDGNRNTDFSGGSCSETETSHNGVSWSVDLGTEIYVTSLTITGRADHDWGLPEMFEIVVTDATDQTWQCANGLHVPYNGHTITVTCFSPRQGRIVAIHVPGTDKRLTLCEVEVHGRPLDFYNHEVNYALNRPARQIDTIRNLVAHYAVDGNTAAYHGVNSQTLYPSDRGGTLPWWQLDLEQVLLVYAMTLINREDCCGERMSDFDLLVGTSEIYGIANNVDCAGRHGIPTGGIRTIFCFQSIRGRYITLRSHYEISKTVCIAEMFVHARLIPGHGNFAGCTPVNLGMQDHTIADAQISASSAYGSSSQPSHGRLYAIGNWASTDADAYANPWFQVDLLSVITVTGLITQGSPSHDEWVKSFKISSSHDGSYFQYFYAENKQIQVFLANVDRNGLVQNDFWHALFTRIIRIWVVEIHTHPSMRVEIIGCYAGCTPVNLGMQDHTIADAQISASSAYSSSYQPSHGRLYANSHWGSTEVDAYANPWFQVDLLSVMTVTGIITQGAPSFDQWVKSFIISSSHDGSYFQYFYAENKQIQVFLANVDRNGLVQNDFWHALFTRIIRIWVVEIHTHPSMRVEIIGCYAGNRIAEQRFGMSNGLIPDSYLSVSDELNGHGVLFGRLNNEIGAAAWCALDPWEDAWYQVRLFRRVTITRVITQGRWSTEQWVTYYTVSYATEENQFDYFWQNGEIKEFKGNEDRSTYSRGILSPAVEAKYIRINPIAHKGYQCMRLEIVGSYGTYVPQVLIGPALVDPQFPSIDAILSVSSFLDHHHSSHRGVISSTELDPTSWTPAVDQAGEYIQVDLAQLIAITGVEFRTPGDYPETSYVELVMRYGESDSSWRDVTDHDGKTMIFFTIHCCHAFEKIILARFVRFVMLSWGKRSGFRFQLYGVTDYSKTAAGIEEQIVKDDQLSSSNHPDDPGPAFEARLNYPGAWCANTMRQRRFLQVDFLTNFKVHGVATQGKSVGVVSYVTHYQLSFSMDGIIWVSYKDGGQPKVFDGNVNGPTIVKHLVDPFPAQSLRVVPTDWQNQPCMRLEVYGHYAGILHVYSFVNASNSLIKLNGGEQCRSHDGYNMVVVNYTTGELVSCTSADNSQQLGDTLNGLSNDTIVIIATKNVHGRPPDASLGVLESLGGLRLRYTPTSDYHNWILVGFKGDERVGWITEKFAQKGEHIDVSLSIPINKRKMKETYHKWYKGSSDTASMAGDYISVQQDIRGVCEPTNTDCTGALTVAMLTQNITRRETVKATPSISDRFVFAFYAKGFVYFAPSYTRTRFEAQAHCLSMKANLVIIRNPKDLEYVRDTCPRLGITEDIWIGLWRNPVFRPTFQWADGSHTGYTKWSGNEPSSLDEDSVATMPAGLWNNIPGEGYAFRYICQQSVQETMGLVPLGLEDYTIADSSMHASSYFSSSLKPHKGRLNMLSGSKSWCASTADTSPTFTVDLPKRVKLCGVASQAHGGASAKHVAVYTLKTSLDGEQWDDLNHLDGKPKSFLANEGTRSVVINRFAPVVAHRVRIIIESFTDIKACARWELFQCDTDLQLEEKEMALRFSVPKSIPVKQAQSCLDLLLAGKTSDGVYMISPWNEESYPVFCDQTTAGGGWTVFQKRMDGQVNFALSWYKYKDGFGDIYGEYWLGNDKLSTLTAQEDCDLWIILESFSGETLHIHYKSFVVLDESLDYRMYYKGHIGPGANGLNAHTGQPFQTIDKYPNGYPKTYRGAWWYSDSGTQLSNLNSFYSNTESIRPDGIFWFPWKNSQVALKKTTMMVRRRRELEGALGMKENCDHCIRNVQIRSNFDNSDPHVANFDAWKARLNNNLYWFVGASALVGGSSPYYLQVRLPLARVLTHISTQGRTCCNNYVKTYRLEMLDPAANSWKDYKEKGQVKIFDGNNERSLTDVNDIVSNCLRERVPSKGIRVWPVSCQHHCSVRMEIYSCQHSCAAPVGLQSGLLPDERMTSSSFSNEKPPERGRLLDHAFWRTDETDLTLPYLEVIFSDLFFVTVVETQGGYASTIGGECWVKTYALAYKDTTLRYQDYGGNSPKIFAGNIDKYAVIRNRVEHPFLAHMLRILPKTYERLVCLRAEIYGCYQDNPKVLLHTDTLVAGSQSLIKGRYRYCETCACPGCKKSICLRVFNKFYPLATHFKYDCEYHEFNMSVTASILPGLHKVYASDSDSSDCLTNTDQVDERLVGTIAVTQESSNIEIDHDESAFHPSDCLQLLMSGSSRSGYYVIKPDVMAPMHVYCDQDTKGGGWTLLLRRFSAGPKGFNKLWHKYAKGFGSMYGHEFWLGNELAHRLTSTTHEVLFDLESESGGWGQAFYETFVVDSEANNYKLTIDGYQESVTGDAMSEANGMPFTTEDRDNDLSDDHNCAALTEGGWWYGDCVPQAFLTGRYNFENSETRNRWDTWTGHENLVKAEMKIRRKNVVKCSADFCYYLLSVQKAWSDAVQECRGFNADLPSIYDAAENTFVAEILTEHSLDAVYLGLGKDSSQTWTDGSRLFFSTLQDAITADNCASLQPSGNWVLGSCTETKHVLCKRSAFCFHGDCYIRSYSIASHADSMTFCQDRGSDLVKISSKQEQQYVHKFQHTTLPGTFSTILYMGLILVGSHYQWGDGSMLQSYRNWYGNEPNGGVNEPCGGLYKGGWADITCTEILFAICDKGPTVRSCDEITKYGVRESGFYNISPEGTKWFKVYCDFASIDDPWTVVQKRVYGAHQINYHTKTWQEYSDGFAEQETAFWVGNQYLHLLTKTPQKMKIVIHTNNGFIHEATYENVTIADEASAFVIDFESYSGTAGDSLSVHRGMKFSATDKDFTANSCVTSHPGGWWLADCLDSNLNGKFVSETNSEGTLFWRSLAQPISKTVIKLQAYKVSDFQPHSIINTDQGTLGIRYLSDSTEIRFQTVTEEWFTRVAPPEPSLTNMVVTWDENSYLRYYENGHLLSEVSSSPRRDYVSGLVEPSEEKSIWLRQLTLWDKALNKDEVWTQYTIVNFNFEADMDSWKVVNTSNYTWHVRHACTPSEGTGPCGDHTHLRSIGTFIYAEGSLPAANNDKARLESLYFLPMYRCLSFWYHVFGSDAGILAVNLLSNNSSPTNVTWNVTGNQGLKWKYMEIDIDVVDPFQIVFEATRGAGFQSDIALDDVALSSDICVKECKPSCIKWESCNQSTLTCDFQGNYDYRWRLDHVDVLQDDRRWFTASDLGSAAPVQSEGAIDRAIELSAGSEMLLGLLQKVTCENEHCFPKVTLSTWLKYDPLSAGQILRFQPYVSIRREVNTPENNIAIKVRNILYDCQTTVFAPMNVWSHITISTHFPDRKDVYLDGRLVATQQDFTCTTTVGTSVWQDGQLRVGLLDAGSFKLDDIRLLFDTVEASDNGLAAYNHMSGNDVKKYVSIKANLTSSAWSDDLLDDSSVAYSQLASLVKTKISETFKDQPNMTDVLIRHFTQGSVIVDAELVFINVSYADFLTLEEALFVNNSFGDLPVNGVSIKSSSVPGRGPIVSGHPLSQTSLSINWTLLNKTQINGIFRGYTLLYRVTDTSTYRQFENVALYGETTSYNLTGLQVGRNYTIRVLAFSHNGDGLLSEPVYIATNEGLVLESAELTPTSINSTAIYTNWTILPTTTDTYYKLLGYYLSYWKASEASVVFNASTIYNNITLEGLEKWTDYCFNVSGYTMAGLGAFSQPKCVRTLEDVPEAPPSNVTVVDTTTSTIELRWNPPPAEFLPGIIRYYNLSYRVLNHSVSDVISIALPGNVLSYRIEDLTGRMLLAINITAFTIANGPVHSLLAITDEGVPLVGAFNVSLFNTSSTSLYVNWTSIPRSYHNGILLGYTVFVWETEQGLSSLQNFSFPLTTLSSNLSFLAKWTDYCVRVAGFTAVGVGQGSPEKCVRTFEDAPEHPPSNGNIFNATWSRVQLQWYAPPVDTVPGIIRQYNVTIRNLNYTDDTFRLLSFSATETLQTMDNLFGLTLYEINITAITILPGPWSSTLFLTSSAAPVSPPINVSLFNTSSTTLSLNWSVVPHHLRNGIVLGYRVFHWRQDQGSAATALDVTVPSPDLEKHFEDLEKYTDYCFQVLAFTDDGDGPKSPVQCIRTFEDAPEMAPPGLNISNITWDTGRVYWDSIDFAFIPGILRNYRVVYRILDPGFDQSNQSFLVPSAPTFANLTGLYGFTNYEVIVAGVTIKDGPASVIRFQTEEGVPTSPPAEIRNTTTPSTITVSWSDIPITGRHGIIRGYNITYEEEGTINQMKHLTFGPDVQTSFLFKLIPYTFYNITLCGYTSVGKGVKAHFRIRTAEGVPTISPKEVVGTNFSSPTTIVMEWKPLNTRELQGVPKGYLVHYKPFSVSDEELWPRRKTLVKIINDVSLNKLIITGLSSYTTYEISIAAISGGGTGPHSKSIYIATCRCFKTLHTNYWNIQPYTNISRDSSKHGFFPYLLDIVTVACCQTCLAHGLSDIDYFTDGKGGASEKTADIEVKKSVDFQTDFSFPVYGFNGQETYSRYYGYAGILDAAGVVFIVVKPDLSLLQGEALMTSIMSIIPLLGLATIFAILAGIIIWCLESRSNEDEFPQSFTRGAPCGFWWAYITMTTVGYGDKTARTFTGRIFAVIWILVGLAMCSILIGAIGSAFTSNTIINAPEAAMLYGAEVAALENSPEHVLGVRRNAKVNTYANYTTLEGIQQALLSGEVSGILVDTYAADYRKDLFGHSKFIIQQVIDLKSTYGVVMGTDASKLRKCFNKYWRNNAAFRSEYIYMNTNPLMVSEIEVSEQSAATYDPTADRYKLALYTCIILLVIFSFCGLIYEILRRRRASARVAPSQEILCKTDLEKARKDLNDFAEELQNNIRNLKLQFKQDIRTFVKLKQC